MGKGCKKIPRQVRYQNLKNETIFLLNLIQQTPYDWAYKTEPQEHSMGAMNNRQSAW